MTCPAVEGGMQPGSVLVVEVGRLAAANQNIPDFRVCKCNTREFAEDSEVSTVARRLG
jgi:hypothetical protein